MEYQCEFYCCQIIMSSRNYSHKSHKLTKKEQDLIHRFTYHSVNIQQAALQMYIPHNDNETIHQAIFGTNHYHCFQITRDSYQHQSLLDSKSLGQLAEEYLKPLAKKSHQNSNAAAQQYMTKNEDSRGDFVEFIVVQEKKNQNFSDKYFQKSDKSEITINSSADFKEPYNFAIYVVHHVNEQHNPNPTWDYFVEKISLQADPYSKADKSLPITYELIISFPKESWLQMNVMSLFRPPPYQRQIESILNEAKQRLDLFQSCLAKNLTKKAQQEMQQSQNCHPEFKREDKLPAQHYKKFQKIKTQIYSYYSTINRGKKLNRFFLDNLICRYMINKKYEQHETLTALKKYLEWEKMMRSKYSLQYFKEFHQWGIFQYLGKDYQGRPLILFRSDRFIPERIHNQSEYNDYNAYMFEIFGQDQMEGYIDEYSIIGDYRSFSTANFKLSIAKGFLQLSNEFFPERQNKLIIYGMNSFGEWIYKIIKPILPSFIIQKILIFGEDVEPFKQQMKKFMDPKLVIPLLDRKTQL